MGVAPTLWDTVLPGLLGTLSFCLETPASRVSFPRSRAAAPERTDADLD